MPYINVRVTPAITTDQKRELIREITATMQRVLDKSPEHTHIVIDEIDEANWGFAGELTSEYRARRS